MLTDSNRIFFTIWILFPRVLRTLAEDDNMVYVDKVRSYTAPSCFSAAISMAE